MKLRSFALALLASTAFTSVSITSVSFAQTAAQPPADPNAAPANAAPAQQAPATTPAPAKPAAAPAPAAAAPAPAAKPAAAAPAAAPKPAAAAAAPAPAAAPSFGTVYVKEPELPKPAPAFVQTGLTASPADYAVATEKKSAAPAAAATGAPAEGAPGAATGTGRPTSLGGVTGQDFGGGYIIKEEAKKSRSSVTRDAIDKQQPTSNPFQAISLLPGVVTSSNDNNGLNGGSIRVRGFSGDHLGLTIEGAPINDSGNYTVFPQEYTDAENLGQISLSQGSGEIDSPHIGATGGVLNVYMRDPSKTPGVLTDYSFGSHAMSRIFVRGETGQIGPVRSFISVSKYDEDHFGGNPGSNDRKHVDFKTVWDLSPGNTVRFAAIYNDATNNFINTQSLNQFRGYQDYKYSSSLPSSFFKTTSPIDQGANGASNYYGYRVNPFQNLILSAPSNFTITDKLKFDTIPYYWYGYGNGGGIATLREASAGLAPNATGNNAFYYGNLRVTGTNLGGTAALTDRISFYNPNTTETQRPGIINKFTLDAGAHRLIAGHWFELAEHRQTQPYFTLNSDGNVRDPFSSPDPFTIPSGATCQVYNQTTKVLGATVPCPNSPLQRRDQKTETMTNAIFVGDSWKFAPGWTADYGVKQVFINRNVKNYLPGSIPADVTLDDAATLPQVGVSYKIDDRNTVFGNFATTFRSAPNFTLIQSYAAAGLGLSNPDRPPAEHGYVFELGHRYQTSMLETSITGFLGRYENYQVGTSIADPSGSGAFIQYTYNAGGLMNYGINAEIGTAPIYNFRPYISGELLHTELLDNTLKGINNTTLQYDTYNTKGKKLPGAPDYSFGLGLDYDNGHLFANLGYKYLGSQQATFMNDEQLRGYGRLDAGIGYRFADFEKLKQPELRINFSNVLNARQLTNVSTITGSRFDTVGTTGKTISGSTPFYNIGQDFSFMVTLRAGL